MSSPALVPGSGRGFTLVELLIVMSILAILLAVAAPGLRQISSALQLRTVTYDLVADLLLARSEAIKRGAQINVSPAEAGWQAGWSITVNGTNENINQREHPAGALTFTVTSGTLGFDSTGRPSDTSFRFGMANGYQSYRCVTLDTTGRPRSATTACPS
jgi:type IV fimbrial biogenesis protein FimT